MKVLLISPLGFAVNPEARYAGIEVLVYNYSRELVKEHEVAVMGHAQSVFPDGVTLFPTQPTSDSLLSEINQFQSYQYLIRQYDVIHDFSHQHLASRFMPNLPSLNIFWHAPGLAKYEKAPYNIIALSQWAAREFRRVYHQEAKYQYSIGLDTSLYKLSDQQRNDRFFALGRMGVEKGNLQALMLCQKAGVPLDIQSARGQGVSDNAPLTDYEKAVLALCDGIKYRHLGDLPANEKIKMMQTNKALIYATNHPEVTSHKDQECMLCGMPVITSNIGATPEIVTHGVDGYLCNNEEDFLQAISSVDKLNPMLTYEKNKKRFSIEQVIADYLPLYSKVAQGEHW